MGQYDAALKHSLTAFPGDWARFMGVPPGIAVEPIDTDLSSVSQQLDKLLRVHVDPPYLLHIEPHSYYDEDLDTRILQYQTTARHKLKQDVHTAVVLLYPRAWGPRNRGRVQSASPIGHCRLEFEYQIVRLWELPVETVLEAGIGLLPLAPLANVGADDLPRVVDLMAERLRCELPPAAEAELWTATDILMGVKFGVELTEVVLRAVRDVMKDSPTYQAILEEGVEKGIVQGREDGELRALRSTLLRLGERRFGAPKKPVRIAVQSIHNHTLLDSLLLRLLDVSSWDELLEAVPVDGENE